MHTGQPSPRESTTFHPQGDLPHSLYIHIPFCRHRCGYCNFTLVAGRDYLIDRYLDALETELGWLEGSYKLSTLFFGGGTPSHLRPIHLDRLNDMVRSKFSIGDEAEITAECNPNDMDLDKANALSRLGVNRISLGVQSLNPVKLRTLERDHSPDDIKHAIEIARTFCQSVSIDLIFAAPDETLSQWKDDLDRALTLDPDHLSTYELTYEKGTQFWNRKSHGQFNEINEDSRAEMYLHTIDRLADCGWTQYEISSFSKPKHRCRHNLTYWKGDPYFAFGPGASRFIDGIRETNHQSTMQYLKLVESAQSPVADFEQLDTKSAAKERLAIGLRVIEGVHEGDFKRRTGHSVVSVLGDLVNQLLKYELIQHQDQIWKLTAKGVLLCDWISAEIVRVH
ncbi:MAG: radical SAM family heme chaperone HemW [Mariniblastus sp.]|nr:radical SAM family heme chaperone HemW [Mariniblastus sp.]